MNLIRLFLVFLLTTLATCENPDDLEGVIPEDEVPQDAIEEPLIMNTEQHDFPSDENSTSLQLEPTGIDVNKTSNETAVPQPKPKRISCLRLEPPPLPEPELDVEYEDGSEAGREVKEPLAMDLRQPGVKVVNGSYFLTVLSDQHNSNVTNRTTPAECMLVFFYAKWCPFSAQAAPFFNALGRIYTDIPVYAVDSTRHSGINTQFGILALPTILLFHNSKPVSKFNHTVFNLENYSQFISTLTGIEASGLLEVIESDFMGPLPSEAVDEPDYNLYLAWIFTIVCGLFYFSKSSFCKRLIESVKNNWREVEIQHEHND